MIVIVRIHQKQDNRLSSARTFRQTFESFPQDAETGQAYAYKMAFDLKAVSFFNHFSVMENLDNQAQDKDRQLTKILKSITA